MEQYVGYQAVKETLWSVTDRTAARLTQSVYAPAIIRICCATMVGALVGALAIHENVLKKMADIVTGLGAHRHRDRRPA